MNVCVNRTARLFPDFIAVSKIRHANFSEMYYNELNHYFDSDLGCIIKQDNNYTLFVIPKNALNSEYELFINCFPTNSNKIVRTIDEFDEYWRNSFFDTIEYSNKSIVEIATKKNEGAAKLYSVQHIGLDELNDYQFSTTYDQIHWHIYGVTKSILTKCEPHRFPVDLPQNQKNTFHDVFLRLYFDLMRKSFPFITVDSYTSSLILHKNALSFEVNSLTRFLIMEVISFWKKTWRELASCLTDFSTSTYGRFIPFEPQERLMRIKLFIEANSHLSSDSRRLLIHLAKHIRKDPNLDDPQKKSYWNTLHNNINGSIAITHDFEENTSTLRLAPRILAVRERIGATDGCYLCLKDKSRFLPDMDRENMITIQKALINRLRQLSSETTSKGLTSEYTTNLNRPDEIFAL